MRIDDRREIDGCERIEQTASLCSVERCQRLVLRMDDGQSGRKLLEYRYGRGLIIDEDPSFTAGRDFAADDQLSFFGVDTVGGECCSDQRIAGLKDGGDDGFLFPMAHGLARGAFTQKQRQGVYENGFTGAGLAGQKIEARRELHRYAIDDGIVLDPQFEEQDSSLSELERR